MLPGPASHSPQDFAVGVMLQQLDLADFDVVGVDDDVADDPAALHQR